MTDNDRFTAVALAFANELAQYGLRQIPIREKSAEADGWWAQSARWSGNRPRIGLYFDRLLEEGRRHFWFGFYSSKSRIEHFLNEASPQFEGAVIIRDHDFQENGQLSAQAMTRIKNGEGLVLERYNEEDHYVGKYDIGFSDTSDDQLAEEAGNWVAGIAKRIQPELDAEQTDVIEIKKRTDIDETTRKRLIDARKGQGEFRHALLNRWNGCSVTGCTFREVLRASHVKPWRLSNDKERLDVNNGLLLTATLDALFDRGFVSFDDEGKMIISSRFPRNQVQMLLHSEQRDLRVRPSDAQKAYLRSHRQLFKV